MAQVIRSASQTISVICPTIACGQRVDLAGRRFHGVPMVGSCDNCGAKLRLAGGRLDATPPTRARS